MSRKPKVIIGKDNKNYNYWYKTWISRKIIKINEKIWNCAFSFPFQYTGCIRILQRTFTLTNTNCIVFQNLNYDFLISCLKISTARKKLLRYILCQSVSANVIQNQDETTAKTIHTYTAICLVAETATRKRFVWREKKMGSENNNKSNEVSRTQNNKIHDNPYGCVFGVRCQRAVS